jgi:hypothetical protein
LFEVISLLTQRQRQKRCEKISISESHSKISRVLPTAVTNVPSVLSDGTALVALLCRRVGAAVSILKAQSCRSANQPLQSFVTNKVRLANRCDSLKTSKTATKFVNHTSVKESDQINGETRHVYKILFGNPERKQQLGRVKHRWEDNIKINLNETECESVDWIQLAQ